MPDLPFDPRYGEAVPVGEAIVRVTAPNSGPFTGAGTNTYIVGERDIMVIDPGPDDPAHRRALLQAIADRPVSHILLTHTHRDHVDGLAALRAEVGGRTVGEGRYRSARPLKAGEDNPFLHASDITFDPDTKAADADQISNAELTLSVIATPGHTANHLAFSLGDLCFSGDHVMGWSTTVIAPPDGAMGDYLSSLDRLLVTRHRRYLPGHGEWIDEPHKAVSAMKAHRLMRERAILDRLAKGDTDIPAFVNSLYVGIDDRLRAAAGLSVLAHLEKLEEDGAVVGAGMGRSSTWRLA